MRIPIVAIAPYLRLERGERRDGARVAGVNQRPRGDLVAPPAIDEQPFLRGVAQMPRVIDRLAVRTVTLHQAHLAEQLADCGRLRARQRQIVRSPRIGGDLIPSPARVSADLRFELQQYEVAKAAPGELPARRQARHAAAHDDHRDLADLLRLGEGSLLPQAVADPVRGPDDRPGDPAGSGRPGRRRRHARPAAERHCSGGSGTEPEEVAAGQRA